MARRPVTPHTMRSVLTGRRVKRRLPTRPQRPIKMTTRDVIRTDALREDPWWWIEHRRGIRRPTVGEDPLEARAVPESQVRGFLHERIVWKWLVTVARMVPGVDFDFQSSQFGGRLELGGIVADFLFPYMRIIIEVEGPRHDTPFQRIVDTERDNLLEEMGFRVFRLSTKLIENEQEFNREMKRILGLGIGSGAAGTVYPDKYEEPDRQPNQWDVILNRILAIESRIEAW